MEKAAEKKAERAAAPPKPVAALEPMARKPGTCEAKYGKPITVVEYDAKAEADKEAEAAKVEKARLAKEEKEAAAAQAAADAAVYHPKDAESCKSRVASTP